MGDVASSNFAESGGLIPDQPDATPVVASQADYDKLPHQMQYRDPEGNLRTKQAYQVTSDEDYNAVPEGGTYTDPEGNTRQKPAYEGLNYTAQTLHSMAINPKEQRKALEYAYPGAEIIDTPDGPVVNDNGVMRKAGMSRGVRPFLGGITSGVLPTTGAVLGAMGGGVAAAPTGPGAIAGVAAGGASGGIAGQMANDAIFHAIAGTDRTPGEELTNLGLAGLTSAAGAGVGRGAAAFVPSIKAGASAASAAIPGAMRAFTGATAERLEQAESLGNRGYAVTPSASFPRAAHLQNQVEVLDPAFRTDKPLVQQNRAAYEKEAGGILKEAGVPEFQGAKPKEYEISDFLGASSDDETMKVRPIYAKDGSIEALETGRSITKVAPAYQNLPPEEAIAATLGSHPMGAKPDISKVRPAGDVDSMVKPPSLTSPTAAIPTARVGEALRASAMEQASAADAKVQQLFEQRRQALAQGLPEQQSQRDAILQAQAESKRGVETLLNENYQNINRDVERAYQLSGTGANSGEAWQVAAENLRRTRQAIGERATRMYQDSHALGGDTPIASEPLVAAARQVAEQLPEEFRTTQPAVVRRLEAMGGREEVRDPATGEVTQPAVPPTNPTFAELHELRSLMRTNADFSRLNSDVRNGTFKHFNNVIDDALHDAGAQPHLRAAAEALDQADAFYREQIPIFNSRQLAAVMRGVEAGEPANPIALYKTIVDANQPQMTARIRGLVGPNVWRAVQAAHIDDLMRRSMSKTVRGQVNGKAFAANVLEDLNNGTLHQVQDRAMTDQLIKQVDLLAMSRGEIPVPVNSGDRMLDIVAKARQAQEQATQAAVVDPLKTLAQEGKRLANEEQKALRAGRAERNAEPLGFLFDAKVGTQEAADRILNKPDLVLSVRDKFGPDSHEFKLVQQAYLWKVLQSDMDPGKQLYKIAPEIQHVLFPNQTLTQLQALAKDMDFLTDTKLMRGADNTGGSMMAVAKVEHPPIASLRGITKAIPGIGVANEFAARAMLEKFYGVVASKTSQNPALFTYMLKGLRGTPEQRQMTKEYINKVLLRGGVTGAGAGEGAYQGTQVDQSAPRQAPDGNYYVPDPNRPGKYLQVMR